ncbi:hypothetical protein TSAR_000517, partial [Trichomalopsis sarcophagae]
QYIPFFLNLTSEFGVISADPLPVSSKLRSPPPPRARLAIFDLGRSTASLEYIPRKRDLVSIISRQHIPFFLNLTSEFGVISTDPLPVSSKLRSPPPPRARVSLHDTRAC